MAKKKSQSFSDMIGSIKETINNKEHEQKTIPNIITFVNDPEWLGLPIHPTNPISLYPVQQLMLKAFYRGTLGNEDLELNENEIQICKDLGLTDDDKGNVLDKYYNKTLFTELVLVWGRRSGKDFIVSIIALYEAMKLLECEGGDPYAIYELSAANTINILTIANAKGQAKLAFEEIKTKLLYSKYFQNKYTKDGFTAESIYLLTPKDKKDNEVLKERGLPLRKGSVGIIVGHSNSDSLLGMGCIVLILDEVASYKMTGGSSSGDRIYTALLPTVSTYCRKKYEKNRDGTFKLAPSGQKIVKERIYDGKVISISSPRGREGKFYEIYNNANQVAERLVFRLPTWEVNPSHTRESLREVNKMMSEAEFNMEFGAEFSGVGVENFFTEKQVNDCFIGHNLVNRQMGEPNKIYFAHIDPATSSHNYALVILHRECFMNPETRKLDYVIIVDHIKYWHPSKGKPINVDEVSNYLIGLKRRFHLGLMTYDQWASSESILKLRKASIPNKLTRFNHFYKMTIYKELENLINGNRIKIPYHDLLRNEMIELRRKFSPQGFKVLPKQEGDGVKSDDIVDCLAGACYASIQQTTNRLPGGKVVDSGGNSMSNNIVWRNMQGGVYGVGSGAQVAKSLERHNSWPGYKR